MRREPSGSFETVSVTDEPYRAYVPAPLPPSPALVIDGDLRDQFDQALLSLGRLDSLSRFVPDTSLFIYMFMRKEAVLSSQIEGTQSSLSDFLLFESEEVPGVPLEDVQEVSNYVAAMEFGMHRLREGFPLSLRLVREIHEILLHKRRGSAKNPGEFRRTQNWIGGTRPGNAAFVPPPAHRIMECLDAWEKFLHNQPERSPVLLKAALSHVQFETIHPFLDGNGRVGRLLITLLLCAENILCEPLLYLSFFFKKHRSIYYDLLQRVRLEGDWESWLDFFVTGVKETAEQAVAAAGQIVTIIEQDRHRMQKLGKSAGSALRILKILERRPIISTQHAAEQSGLSVMTVSKLMKQMADLGIVRELTGRARGRIFCYDQYVKILGEGTEPIPR